MEPYKKKGLKMKCFKLLPLVLIVFVIMGCTTLPTTYITQSNTREVIITSEDSTIKAGILIDEPSGNLKNDVPYFWYYADSINNNYGGYTGNLLHGEYLVLDKANNLLIKGQLHEGLKEGEWKYWERNGKLLKTENWKEGKLNGPIIHYDDAGDSKSIVPYENGKIHGKAFYYYEDTTIIKNYDYNKLIPEQSNTSFKLFNWNHKKSLQDTIE
mgnify:CR=1 FL=1